MELRTLIWKILFFSLLIPPLLLILAYIGLFVLMGGLVPTVKIPDTVVSDVLEVDNKEFYLTISGHTYKGWGGDGPFVYSLKMNVVTEGKTIQSLVDFQNETTEEEVRNKIQRRYELLLGDQSPHITVKHAGRDIGIFHVAGLRFIDYRFSGSRQIKSFDSLNINMRDFSIDRKEAEKLVSLQMDISYYDSYYYVNEHLTGANSRILFCGEERSLIILGDDFVNHDSVETKGDVYVSKEAHLMDPVISDGTVFMVGSEEANRRKLEDFEAKKISYFEELDDVQK